MSSSALNLDLIQSASSRIENQIHETPIMTSSYIDNLTNRKIYFKCEHLQKTGSFKARGALNKLLTLKEMGHKFAGVVTYSSGNHGQGIAWVSKQLNLEAIVVVNKGTSKNKVEAIESHGAKVVYCEPSLDAGNETCEQISRELNYEIIESSEDPVLMAGQGTIGIELYRQVPELDAVIVSVNEGGMCAGISTALKSINENIKIYCVEPEGKFLEESLRAGKRLWTGEPKIVDTIADGISTQQAGHLSFPYMLKYVEKNVFTVNDSDIVCGMKLAFSRLKQVVEASSGACVQALIKYNHTIPAEVRHIGVLLCGGNIDIDDLPW